MTFNFVFNNFTVDLEKWLFSLYPNENFTCELSFTFWKITKLEKERGKHWKIKLFVGRKVKYKTLSWGHLELYYSQNVVSSVFRVCFSNQGRDMIFT